MSERIAMSPETVSRRPEGAYDFVVGRDGDLMDAIAASWSTGPSWAVWACTGAELWNFMYAWALAGRGVHLINGLYLVNSDGTEMEIDRSDLWARAQEGGV